MNTSGTSRFWVIAAIIAGATVNLAAGQPAPDWSYTDDFQTSKINTDSYFHSIIWPKGAYPPSEPYLYYKDGQIGFGDYNGQPAVLAYRFPFPQGQSKTISVSFHVDVHFLYAYSGSLQYSTSPDGVIWSGRKNLAEGANIIDNIESARGICYIIFSGFGGTIDNLQVNLYYYSTTYSVPSPLYRTIQAAINKASDGDVIEVAQGTYRGTGNTDIDFQGKAITIYSKMGPDQTIIDCENSHRGFYFHNAEDLNSVLRGFTIKNGKTQGTGNSIGAGIYCKSGSPTIINCKIQQCSANTGAGIGIEGASPTIEDCSITQCYADISGAGIAIISDSNAVIVNSTIQNNFSKSNSKGAGVYCDQSKALLSNCEIRSNGPLENNDIITGGGVYASGAYTDIELQKCLIADNVAQTGAGIYTDSITVPYVLDPYFGYVAVACIVHLTNCTIANNKLVPLQTDQGGGVHSINCDTTIKNTIVWGNDGMNIFFDNSDYIYQIFFNISYSDVQGGSYNNEQGNINEDPCFASPLSGDYHLKSYYGRYNPSSGSWVTLVDPNSPCIDTGVFIDDLQYPQEQLGPEPYPNGNKINMGAYGGTTQASKGYSPRIIHVAAAATTGSNSHHGTSKEDAYAKIQDAVDNAKNGDYVLIWPGTYSEEVTLTGKRVTIQSADDAARISAPTSGYPAFSFNYAEASACVLRNLLFTNTSRNSVAIACWSASPTLTNLTITNYNAGVLLYGGSSPTIKNCIFWQNLQDIEQDDIPGYNYMNTVWWSRFSSLPRGDIDMQRGNISDSNPWYNAVPGDYHLQSKFGRYSPSTDTFITTDQYNSPCIDKGDPTMGSVSEPRPNGYRINMGAYGGTPYASKSSY